MKAYDEKIIEQAKEMLIQECKTESFNANGSAKVKTFLQLELSGLKNECFAVMFLNQQNKLICFEKLFFGTVNSCSVHPRVVLQRALYHNSATIILAHNHPSGTCEPSLSDLDMTKTIQKACAFIDVRVLDHIIVSASGSVSFSERGSL